MPAEQPRGGGTAGTAVLPGSGQGLSRCPFWPSHGRAEKSPVLLPSPSILGAEPLPWASSRPEERPQDHARATEGRKECACCWRCPQCAELLATRRLQLKPSVVGAEWETELGTRGAQRPVHTHTPRAALGCQGLVSVRLRAQWGSSRGASGAQENPSCLQLSDLPFNCVDEASLGPLVHLRSCCD